MQHHSMKADLRREQILAIMSDLHQRAKTQGDFTARTIAQTAHISTVLLYRYVGTEFQMLRSQLPGIHRVRDEVISKLRHENVQLRQQLQQAQEKLRSTAVSELDQAILHIEKLERINLSLQARIKRLQEDLEQNTHVMVHIPSDRPSAPMLTMLNGAKEDEET